MVFTSQASPIGRATETGQDVPVPARQRLLPDQTLFADSKIVKTLSVMRSCLEDHSPLHNRLRA